MFKKLKDKKFLKSFTVTELLVIISIIGILALLVVVGLQPKRAKGRDAKRISEVNSLRGALKLYHMDHGEYPIQEPATWSWCSLEQTAVAAADYCSGMYDAEGDFVLEPYMPKKPEDPIYGRGMETSGDKYSYQYISTSSGQEYGIHADLETREPYEIYSGIFFIEWGHIPPTAVDDFASVSGTNLVNIDVPDNDFDTDGIIDRTTVDIKSNPRGGSISVDLGTGVVTYTNDGESGDPGGNPCPEAICGDGTKDHNILGDLYIDGALAPDGARIIMFHEESNQWVDDLTEDGNGTYRIWFHGLDFEIVDFYIEYGGAFYRARDENGSWAEVSVNDQNNIDKNLYIAPGSDSFTYTIEDDDGIESNVANVSITIM